LETAPTFGRVNALSCPDGLRRRLDRCRMAVDPRANGIIVGGT